MGHLSVKKADINVFLRSISHEMLMGLQDEV